jgi:hypothetical protein
MKKLLATVTLMAVLMVGSFNSNAAIYVSGLKGEQPLPCRGGEETKPNWAIYVSGLMAIYVSGFMAIYVSGLTGTKSCGSQK